MIFTYIHLRTCDLDQKTTYIIPYSRLIASFVCATILSFTANAQVAKFDFAATAQKLSEIEYELLYDFSLAESHLANLEARYKDVQSPELRIKFSFVKTRLYASSGDFVRVRFELNRLRKIQFLKKLNPDDEHVYQVYVLLYGDHEVDDTYLDTLRQIIDQPKEYNQYLRMLVACRLASVFSDQDNFRELERIDHLLQEILKEEQKLSCDFFVYNVLGQSYFYVNEVVRAQTYFQKAKNIAVKNSWGCSVQYTNLNLGETHLYTNNLKLAKNYFDSVLVNKKVTELRDLYQLYGCLEYYYKLVHNPDSSYYFLELRNEIDDELEDTKSRSLVSELDNLYNEEINTFQYQIELKKNQQLRAVISIIILVVIIVSVLIFFIVAQVKRTNILLKRQKSQIESSLLLKEKIIKEIHHRIKNNLQIVSSILNLQSRNIKDPEAIQVIEEGKERIQAIALIHNQLHLAKESAFVEMDTYLLQFIEQMKNSFVASEKKVDFYVDVDKISLSVDNAVPLGLIFCELLSNSYKHAFNNVNEGRISISMHLMETSRFSVIDIVYADNGSGYVGKTPFLKQESTGVEIIQAFVDQLDAEFSIDSSYSGFKVSIRFSPNLSDK